jgi:hypothetical protein
MLGCSSWREARCAFVFILMTAADNRRIIYCGIGWVRHWRMAAIRKKQSMRIEEHWS